MPSIAMRNQPRPQTPSTLPALPSVALWRLCRNRFRPALRRGPGPGHRVSSRRIRRYSRSAAPRPPLSD